MGNEKDIELNALNDEELDGVTGGTQAGNLLCTEATTMKNQKAVQVGKAPKLNKKGLVHVEPVKPKSEVKKTVGDLDGVLLADGTGKFC